MRALARKEPFWLDFGGGVRVRFAPIDRMLRRRANSAAMARLSDHDRERREAISAKLLANEPLDGAEMMLVAEISEIVKQETVRIGILEWDGIGEGRKAIPVTPDLETRIATAMQEDRPSGTIDDFLLDDELFDLADRLYVTPADIRQAEKNVSAGSPRGIGAKATPAKAIASSRAATGRAGKGAKAAPTASTRRKAPKEKRSGRS